MKKYCFFFLVLFNFLAADTSVEIRADAFIPTSNLFRKIYGDAAPSVGIEVSTSILDCYQGWVNFDWLTKRGHSHVKRDHIDTEFDCGSDRTRIDIANISFGIKYPFQNCDCFSPYIGIGPSFSNVWVKDNGDCH